MLGIPAKSLTRSLALAIVLGLCGIAGLASAGASVAPEPVLITGSYSARGSMRGARNSTDSQQYITCSLHHIAGNRLPLVACSARDAAGHFLSCTSSDPIQADMVASIRPESSIYFSVLNGYSCGELWVTNDSRSLDGPAPRATAPSTAGVFESVR